MGNSIRPDLVRRLKSVADPSLSPDSTRLAYTQSWVEPETWETRSQIMLMDLPGGQTREFTQGRRDSSPRFSPSGEALAFLRPDDRGLRQVWVIGAGGGEARRLTEAPGGVLDFAWSPDSRQLVLCADVLPDLPPDGPTGQAIPQVSVVRRVRYRYDTLGWRGDAHFHLFVADVAGGAARQLTDGDWDDLAPVWSPDGSRIAFVSGRRPDRDLLALTEAYVVSASGGEPQCWSADLQGVGALGWSPDSRRLAAIASPEAGSLVLWQGWLYLLEPGAPPHRLTDDSLRPYLGFPYINRPPELRWTAEGRVLFLAECRGESFLAEVPAEGGAVRRLAGGGQSTALTLDSQARQAVVLSVAPDSPSDLHHVEVQAGKTRRLTKVNRQYLAAHPPAQMEKFCLQRGGLEVECRLFLPPDLDRSRRYPLVLDVHGGPNGAFYDAFVPLQQALVGAGYLVLAVNPRGSCTYGNDFMMAVLGDWGGEDYLDLMAAVGQVADRPYVDSSRLGVHGYSYGGYMASWIVGHTHRFRAAVVGAPCIDLVSMYGTSDIGISFGERQWGGSLAEGAEELVRRSPLSYAAAVETPVLLLHGEADLRCPIAQSEAYFTLLKRLGKEVELVRFPGCAHSFPRLGHPKMREEYLARTVAWFDKYLA